MKGEKKPKKEEYVSFYTKQMGEVKVQTLQQRERKKRVNLYISGKK